MKIFWLSLFQLIDGAVNNVRILHILRDAGIWKAMFQNKKINKENINLNPSQLLFLVTFVVQYVSTNLLRFRVIFIHFKVIPTSVPAAVLLATRPFLNLTFNGKNVALNADVSYYIFF